MTYPTPHKEKIIAAIANPGLDAADKKVLESTLSHSYPKWLNDIEATYSSKISTTDKIIKLVEILNNYKNFIELEVIFNSKNDFLYRQKGQLKLDNSVLEEFLPRLVHPSIIEGINLDGIDIGPARSLSGIQFKIGSSVAGEGTGLMVKLKDQDFAISRKLFIKSSHKSDFSQTQDCEANLSYVVAECKTNLDKTMFQEANATASDLKQSVLGAKYLLICEWLDMKPISTLNTDIDEVLILRKAKRLGAEDRKNLNTYEGRCDFYKEYKSRLNKNPISVEVITRLVNHIKQVMTTGHLDDAQVLKQGFF